MNILLLLLLPIFIVAWLFTGNSMLIFSGLAMLSMIALVSDFFGGMTEDNAKKGAPSNDPLREMLNDIDTTGITISDFFSRHSLLIVEIIGITLAMAIISFFGWCLWSKHIEKKEALSMRFETSLHKRLELDGILLAALQKRGIISNAKEATV